MSPADIKLSQFESHLWESANILRGPVDAADFKTYVFPLLFFKRLSDVHDEEHATALEEAEYAAMAGPMFFGDVPSFDEILRAVGEFEQRFNQG